MTMPRRLVVGPFNRVEGDLEVRLTLEGTKISRAEVCAPMYRGFEQIMVGRTPLDALSIVPRVCGICSVSQSLAAGAALRDLSAREQGVSAASLMAENGRLASLLVHAAENIADHLTHSFVFFLPDFAHASYQAHAWHSHAVESYAATTGRRSAAMIRLRARLLHVVGLLAGKWPHSLALQPGGTTVVADSGTKARLLSALADVRRGLEEQVFAAPLDRIAGLDSLRALTDYADEGAADSADFRFFLSVARDLGLHDLGRCTVPHLSFGAYPGGLADGQSPVFSAGVWTAEQATPDIPWSTISEDVSHAWYDGDARHPDCGLTLPNPDRDDAYSWSKAARLAGQPAQTGALSRQLVDGHPLLRTLTMRDGSTVVGRVIARFIEMATLIPLMEGWVRALRPRDPFCLDVTLPRQGSGTGVCEAARGALGHWISVADGAIRSYQIIAPTTWNFSPRDTQAVPGPLEQALVGVPAPDGTTWPQAVQHVVRSFDPCMVCTVH